MDEKHLEQLKRIADALDEIAVELGILNEEGIVVFKQEFPNQN